jgi:hypothetical protein
MAENPTVVNNYVAPEEERRDFILGAVAGLVNQGEFGPTVTLNAGGCLVSGQVTSFDSWLDLATVSLDETGVTAHVEGMREVLDSLKEDIAGENRKFIHLRNASVYLDSASLRALSVGLWRMPLVDVAGWYFGMPASD